MRLTRRRVLVKTAAALAAAAFGPKLISPALILSARADDNLPKAHRVEITGFNFVPDKLDARSGDTITWINRDIAPHTATADDKTWDTGTIKKGKEKSLLVTADMSLTYFCRFHPMMKASLEVVLSDG